MICVCQASVALLLLIITNHINSNKKILLLINYNVLFLVRVCLLLCQLQRFVTHLKLIALTKYHIHHNSITLKQLVQVSV